MLSKALNEEGSESAGLAKATTLNLYSVPTAKPVMSHDVVAISFEVHVLAGDIAVPAEL
jgi:hypothetical protein